MIRAKWNGEIIAEGTDTVIVDRKHYFKVEDIKDEYFETNDKHTICEWKGEASYYTLSVNGKKNADAAWYYANPKEKAMNIKGRVVFSYVHGVEVVEE